MSDTLSRLVERARPTVTTERYLLPPQELRVRPSPLPGPVEDVVDPFEGELDNITEIVPGDPSLNSTVEVELSSSPRGKPVADSDTELVDWLSSASQKDYSKNVPSKQEHGRETQTILTGNRERSSDALPSSGELVLPRLHQTIAGHENLPPLDSLHLAPHPGTVSSDMGLLALRPVNERSTEEEIMRPIAQPGSEKVTSEPIKERIKELSGESQVEPRVELGTYLQPNPTLTGASLSEVPVREAPGPRLVIGRLTVEIVPNSEEIAPHEVTPGITQVIQPPAPRHSRISKLRFGLGQL